MATTHTTSAPATESVSCVILNSGHTHLIAQRPSIGEIKEKVASLYGTARRYMPKIVLKSGVIRQVIMGQFTVFTDDRLVFSGVIANGANIVHVEVTFTGATGNGGYVTIKAAD